MTPCTATSQASLFFTISQSLFKLVFIEMVIPSRHLILCHRLLLLSIFPSISIFSKESILHIRWPKYWSFSISPSNQYSRLISFRIYWFDLAVQGTLKSLLQHNSKASILQCSAFFMVQLSLVESWLIDAYSNLCLHLHRAFSPVCKLPSSYTDTAILDLGHTLIQYDFILHCLHCKLHLTLFTSAKFYL